MADIPTILADNSQNFILLSFYNNRN